MEKSEFIERVRKVLDMDNISELIIAEDTDASTLDAIIENNVLPACKEIVSIAPARMLTPGTDYAKSAEQTFRTVSDDMYVAEVDLPDEFYRLLSVKMNDWERPANIIYDDDPEYALQSSQWAGLRGNPETPVAVLVKSGETCGYSLELYTCTSESATIEKLLFVPIPFISHASAPLHMTLINIPTRVEDACVYACASLTAETFGNATLAERFMAHAYRLAEITTNTSENNGNKE